MSNSEGKEERPDKVLEGEAAEQEAQPDELVAELTAQVEAAQEEIARISAERDTWQSKATLLFDQYNRAKSDFDGFRKRTERDFEDRLIREKSEFLENLLEVMDNFERFLKAAESSSSSDPGFAAFHKGVEMIQRQFMDTLSREGVERIESPVGKQMDPQYHDAVAAVDGGGEHGVVVEELRTGYTYKGTVLRATRVKVIR
ncbi:MAG: nucleotide exchange factor GrpE [Bacillota bacterium]|jgi:molecular chaperone GrpE